MIKNIGCMKNVKDNLKLEEPEESAAFPYK